MPSNVLFFDSETNPEPWEHDPACTLHALRIGCAIAYRWEKGKRTRQAEVVYKTPLQFWDFLSSRLHKKLPLWVFAHNIGFDLGTVDAWPILVGDRCQWSCFNMEGGVVFLKGVMDGYPIIFCDTTNYWRCPLASVGKAAGLPKMDMPEFSDSDYRWLDYCRNDVEVLARGMETLWTFWREQELGPWARTLSALAFSAYRSRFMRHKVLVHSYKECLEVERGAYFGGRVDTPFTGRKTPCAVTETDVNSLYPWACLSDLPYRVRGMAHDPSSYQTRMLLKDYACVAELTVASDSDTYPCRIGQEVYYPHGRYKTFMADAELRRAMESGQVQRIKRLCYYEKGPIFQDYMEHFWRVKDEAQKRGDDGWRTLAKLLMNSLYGKTWQLAQRWLPWTSETFRHLEEIYRLPQGTMAEEVLTPIHTDAPETFWSSQKWPMVLRVRTIWGQPEICVPRGESRDSCPQIAACVTSLGRVRLTDAQKAAGASNWYYSDTDSVWVSDAGLDGLRFRGLLGEGEPGKLAVKGRHDWLRVWGPKDYETPSGSKIKGVRKNAREIAFGVYEQLQFPSFLSQLKEPCERGVLVRTISKHLRRGNRRLAPPLNGRTRPLNFPEEFPQGGLATA